ncbi:hypothetical protein TNCV_3580391 [Trichonephila clavipes]|nr:hypothetical protein TNCV_3580391 [Trichonephila clavipes]
MAMSNTQNGRIWSEANPQVYVETPLHPEKLTGVLYGLVESLVRTSSKTMKATNLQSCGSNKTAQHVTQLYDMLRIRSVGPKREIRRSPNVANKSARRLEQHHDCSIRE